MCTPLGGSPPGGWGVAQAAFKGAFEVVAPRKYRNKRLVGRVANTSVCFMFPGEGDCEESLARPTTYTAKVTGVREVDGNSVFIVDPLRSFGKPPFDQVHLQDLANWQIVDQSLSIASWNGGLCRVRYNRILAGEKSLQGFPLCRVKGLDGLGEICQIGRNCAGFCAR